MSKLFIGADVTITLTGMSGGGSYLNAATATWTLADNSGTTVTTGSLSYVSASNGNYSGVIDAATTGTLTEGAVYTLTVTFAQSGYDDKRRLRLSAAYRQDT